jgi:hypothetical protein
MPAPAPPTVLPRSAETQRTSKLFHLLATACALFITVWGASGCSVFLAATQPPRKNLSLLAPGTSRAALIAEFGIPRHSRLVNLRRVDIFTFTQGYTKESRASRAIAHGTADVITGGLWELAGTPTEMIFSGDQVSFEVTYDAQDRVLRVSRLNH